MSKTESHCRIIADTPVGNITKDNDPFGFFPFIDTLASMATTAKNRTPFAIIVDGPWDCGKTSMMESTKARIEEVINFDNFRFMKIYIEIFCE